MPRKRKPGRREPNGKPSRKIADKPEKVFQGAMLDENITWSSGSMSLVKEKKVNAGPMVRDQAHATVRDVETRIMRAMQTLRSLPDHERRFFTVKSGHPPYVQEHIDAYASVKAKMPRFEPTPFDVSDYLRALSWTRHLQRHQWKILWWRSFGLSFGLIAQYIGQSDETARRKYREAIIDAWTAANSVTTQRAA